MTSSATILTYAPIATTLRLSVSPTILQPAAQSIVLALQAVQPVLAISTASVARWLAPRFVRKAADSLLVNAVPAADPELQVQLFAGNTYRIDAMLSWSQPDPDATTGGGIRVGLDADDTLLWGEPETADAMGDGDVIAQAGYSGPRLIFISGCVSPVADTVLSVIRSQSQAVPLSPTRLLAGSVLTVWPLTLEG